MDLLLLKTLVMPKLKEKFEPAPKPMEATKSQSSNVLSLILSILIGSVAAYLSWQCNTLTETNVVLKIIFALFAFIFGLLYIILYFFFRWGDCKYIKDKVHGAEPFAKGGRRVAKSKARK